MGCDNSNFWVSNSGSQMGKLTEEEVQLIYYLEQEWLLHGYLATCDACVQSGVCSADVYDRALRKREFRDSLLARGIELRTDNSIHPTILTPEQLLAINTVLDFSDTRTRQKKLASVGLSTTKFNSWLKQPAFNQYLQKRAEAMLGDSLHEGHTALLRSVQQGDLNAVKFLFEVTGRYNPRQDSINIESFLIRVLEILQRRITDGNLLSAIANDLLSLGSDVQSSYQRPAIAGELVQTVDSSYLDV